MRGRDRPGAAGDEKIKDFSWNPFKKYRFWEPGRVGSGRGSKNQRFSFKFLLKSIDFESRRCSSDRSLERDLSLGVILWDPGIPGSRDPTESLLVIGISWKPYQYMIFGGAKSHRVIGLFFFKRPITRWDLGGPRGHFPRKEQWISVPPRFGESWRPYPTFRSPAQTLRSRAHPQDDVSCSAPTPSNYNSLYYIMMHYDTYYDVL